RRSPRSALAAGAWRTSARRLDLGGGGVRADAIDLGNEHHLRGATRRVLLLREEGVQHGREELAGALRVLRPEDPLERLLHPGLEEEGVHVLLERLLQLGEGEVFRYRRQAFRLTDLGRRGRRWKRDALTRAPGAAASPPPEHRPSPSPPPPCSPYHEPRGCRT